MQMKSLTRHAVTGALLAGSLAALVGCAQQVGDIDRTSPNKLSKSDFEGTWYMRQTVTDVPHTNAFFFTGLSTGLEKMNFEITEGALIGYRSYELVPGAEPEANTQGVNDTQVAEGLGEGHNPGVFKGSPVVAYRIQSHFDVQRSYNSATGEQTNVITENGSDRFWNERDFMRVDWSSNMLSNISLFDTDNTIQYQYYYGDEDPLAQTFRQEFDPATGEMNYFEFTSKAIIVPSYACYYYASADCGPTQVEIVTSYVKAPKQQVYEVVEYDNVDMYKFGYFRTERVTYDRKRGLRRSGQIFLPNRHNIWETAYKADGSRIPLTERTPKPVVYYINQEMPSELWSYNENIGKEWDRAFTRAAAAAKGMTPEAFTAEFGAMYVVCHNPVQLNDDASCGEAGKVVNVGDVRYNHIYWVHQPQLSGPLGYGPSAADPETGEIISGTAYVYGASVDTYAASSLDVIKLLVTCEESGEESPECQAHLNEITSGSDVKADILNRLKPGIDPRSAVSPELARIPVPTDIREMIPAETMAKIEHTIANPLPFDYGFEDRQLNRMKENSFDLGLLDDQMVRDLTGNRYQNAGEVPADVLEEIRPANWMTAEKVQKLEEARIQHFAKNNIMLASFVDDVVAGLAISLAEEAKTLDPAERDEYMYQKIRGLIYKGVMEHEIGHTVGLRHNFQGSYDSLNYFDNFWKLRKENLREIEFVNDLYEVSALTENQRLGRVVDANGNVVDQLTGGQPEYGYSSIMDYGLRFNTDLHGIGKYDEAAIIYAYSGGFDGKFNEQNEEITDKGYVETWSEDAFAAAERGEDGNVIVADLIREFDFRESLAYTHLLEGYNYTTIANMWGDVGNISKRELVKFDEVRAAREAGDAQRPVEVPFMFCTDDWVGVDSSCHRWDHGADPMEQTNYVINSYKDYYWFTNFARDSLEWSPYSKVGRTLSRYFSYLTNIYQQLFFGGDYDGIQSTYRWLASNAGLNLIAEVLMTPNYGEHVVDSKGVLVHCFDANSDEFEENGQTTSTQEKCSNAPDVEIAMGQGRYPFNRYDYNSGYTYYYYPTEAGHFYDYLAAILALTSSRATVRGVDVQTDSIAYSLPYYLVFDNQLNNLFGSIWLETPADFGSVLVDGEVVSRPLSPVSFGNTRVDPKTGRTVNSNNIPQGMESGRIIQPYHSWSMRVYPELYGMAFFSSNYQLTFAENNNIFRLGNGEAFDPGDGFELITCTDPTLGHTYGAVRNRSSANLSAAVRIVQRCAQNVALYQAARSGLRLEEAATHQRNIEQDVIYINMMRSYYDVFGQVF